MRVGEVTSGELQEGETVRAHETTQAIDPVPIDRRAIIDVVRIGRGHVQPDIEIGHEFRVIGVGVGVIQKAAGQLGKHHLPTVLPVLRIVGLR